MHNLVKVIGAVIITTSYGPYKLTSTVVKSLVAGERRNTHRVGGLVLWLVNAIL